MNENDFDKDDKVRFVKIKDLENNLLKEIGCNPEKCSIKFNFLDEVRTEITCQGAVDELKQVAKYFTQKDNHEIAEESYSLVPDSLDNRLVVYKKNRK